MFGTECQRIRGNGTNRGSGLVRFGPRRRLTFRVKDGLDRFRTSASLAKPHTGPGQFFYLIDGLGTGALDSGLNLP